ncbi:MAG TPA: flippase, partial [Longimicrobiales bacterium]
MSSASDSAPPTVSVPLDHHERQITRNFFTLGSGELIARIIGFGATILAAHRLGPESYGIIGFAMTLMLYAATIADLGMEQYGPREVTDRKGDVDTLVSSVLLVRFAFSAALAAVLAIIGLLFLTEPEGSAVAVYSVALLAVGANVKWVHVGLDRTGTASTARLLAESVKLIAVVTFVREPSDFYIVPLAHVAGDMLGALLMLLALRRAGLHLRFEINRELVKTVLTHSRPLLATAVLGMLIYNADVVMLRIFRDRTEVGLYLVAYTLLNFLGVLGGVITLSVLPTLRRLRDDVRQRNDIYFTAMARALAAGLPVAVGGALLAAPLIDLVFGAQYHASADGLKILIWTFPLLLLRSVEQGALIAQGRQGRVMQTTGAAAFVNISLNLIAIPLLGIVGAAATTLTAEIVRYFLARRFAAQATFPHVAPGRLWRPVIASAVMAAVVFLLGPVHAIVAVAIGAAVYVTVLVVTGGIAYA